MNIVKAPVRMSAAGSNGRCAECEAPLSKGLAFVDMLGDDVSMWLDSVSNYFTNERHLQVELAIYLEKSGHYAKVFTEYRVPLEEIFARRPQWSPELDGTGHIAFPWQNQVALDIVVLGHDGRYAAVELKYSTRRLGSVETLFSEPLRTGSPILKDQAANNVTMYSYWKDVRRLEAMAEVFDKVEGGIALIVGNSRDLWLEPRSGALYTPFSTHETRQFDAGEHSWSDAVSASIKGSHPDFATRGSYVCMWKDTGIVQTARNGDIFRSMMIKVYK